MPKKRIPIWPCVGVAFASSVSCVAIGWLLGKAIHVGSWRLCKEQADFWDVAIKGITATLGIIGAVAAALKYFSDKKRESQKAFLEKRLDVYFRLGKALAKIMNHDADDSTDTQWQPAKETFFNIFWGEIPLVADKPVSEAVRKYAEALFAIRDGMPKDQLAPLSTAITKACRKSLGDSWRVDQHEIDGNPFTPNMIRKRVL